MGWGLAAVPRPYSVPDRYRDGRGGN